MTTWLPWHSWCLTTILIIVRYLNWQNINWKRFWRFRNPDKIRDADIVGIPCINKLLSVLFCNGSLWACGGFASDVLAGYYRLLKSIIS
jgi:hypothetical protein